MRLARAGRALAGGSAVVGLLGLCSLPWVARYDFEPVGFLVQASVWALGLGGIAWVTLPNQPRNGAIWAFAGSGFFAALVAAGVAGYLLFSPDWVSSLPTAELDRLSLAELPRVSAMTISIALWAQYPGLFLGVTLGLFLFPDGRFVSRFFRWAGWATIAALATVTVLIAALGNPWSTHPMGSLESGTEEFTALSPMARVAENATLVVGLGAILAVVSLFIRYRRSTAVIRRQIRWMALGGLLAIVLILIDGVANNPLILLAAMAVILITFGIAITKYKVYAVDIVISKVVTYGSLAVLIGLLYATAVFAFIVTFGDAENATGDLGLALPMGATLIVALAFEPLRRRLQRWANRLVYGKRAEPAQVLSQLAGQFENAAIGGDLAGLAGLLREGTAAEEAVVWLRVGETIRAVATSPADAGPHPALSDSTDDVRESDTELVVPVTHAGEALGALQIIKTRAHTVTTADKVLLRDVAAGAGLLLRNIRLHAELADRARQLEVSRRRLIEAQDAVRHRLERDLHDGAQQQVVALKVKLGLAKAIAEREGLATIEEHLTSLAQETDRAIDQLRRIARGIYPPLLEAEGLATALAAAANTFPSSVTINATDVGRYERAIEETMYFGALTAIASALEAGATGVDASLSRNDGALLLSVTSDAVAQPDPTALTDRIDAMGGSLRVSAAGLVAEIRVDTGLVDAGTAP